MFLGWKTLFIDDTGKPVFDRETDWVASCFILLFFVVHVGEVKSYSEWSEE